jgi:hypothetical protein
VIALALAGAWCSSARAALVSSYELTGIATRITGGSSLSEGHSTSDVYGTGVGFTVGVHLGFTRYLSLGYRTGLFRDEKDITPGAAPAVWSSLPDYNPFRAQFTTRIERRLSSIPHHLVLQNHGHFAKRFGFYDEVGAGLTRFTSKMHYFSPNGSQFILAAYQTNFSVLLGGGLTWDYRNVFTVMGGVSVLAVPTRDGQVWASGDNPQFVTATLGIRYPKP